LVRDLHPEFGYLGSLHLFGRKLGLVLVFIGFGVIAGMSGLAVFMADEQPDDPMKAMALAPPDAMSRDPGLVPPPPVDASVPIVPAQKPAETKTSRPACQEGSAVDCAPLNVPKVRRVRPTPAANERPAIAAVPIGRVDPPPQIVPAEATPTPPSSVPVPVPAAAPEPVDVSGQPAEVTPTVPAPVAPPPAVKKQPRPRIEQAERGERYREREQPVARQPVGRSNYGSPVWAGYARVY
jgi:hypothetical protein